MPLQSKRVKYDMKQSPKKHNSVLLSDDELESALQQWFNRIVPHVWYKILPSSNDDVYSIDFAIGKAWNSVSAVLLRLKYLAKYKDEY